jgi:hypothetical protein
VTQSTAHSRPWCVYVSARVCARVSARVCVCDRSNLPGYALDSRTKYEEPCWLANNDLGLTLFPSQSLSIRSLLLLHVTWARAFLNPFTPGLNISHRKTQGTCANTVPPSQTAGLYFLLPLTNALIKIIVCSGMSAYFTKGPVPSIPLDSPQFSSVPKRNAHSLWCVCIRLHPSFSLSLSLSLCVSLSLCLSHTPETGIINSVSKVKLRDRWSTWTKITPLLRGPKQNCSLIPFFFTKILLFYW